MAVTVSVEIQQQHLSLIVFLDDHHFHYGYFIHAAALIARIDEKLGHNKSWLQQNEPFVNALVADVCPMRSCICRELTRIRLPMQIQLIADIQSPGLLTGFTDIAGLKDYLNQQMEKIKSLLLKMLIALTASNYGVSSLRISHWKREEI